MPVLILGLTQIVGYGTLYYSFALLAGDIAADIGWPVSWVFGLFSLSLLAGGLVAPLAGRLIDRHGGPIVMAAGSAAAALALALTAMAEGPTTLALALIACELAAILVQYDAAFATLVQISGPHGRRQITYLTLIAGFASTVFWPFTTFLDSHLDWRTIMFLFAGMNLLICLPAHGYLELLGRKRRKVPADIAVGDVRVEPTVLPIEMQKRAEWLMMIGFALSSFLLSAGLTQMVPLLQALGLGVSALTVAALFGPAQVLVRFLSMGVATGRHPLDVTLVTMALLPAGTLILAATAPSLAGAVVFALLFGFGSGLKSIVQGTLPLALFGRAGYGARLGRMASLRMVLAALAPFAVALLIDAVGPKIAVAITALIGLTGLIAFLDVLRMVRLARAPAPVTVSPAATDKARS